MTKIANNHKSHLPSRMNRLSVRLLWLWQDVQHNTLAADKLDTDYLNTRGDETQVGDWVGRTGGT